MHRKCVIKYLTFYSPSLSLARARSRVFSYIFPLFLIGISIFNIPYEVTGQSYNRDSVLTHARYACTFSGMWQILCSCICQRKLRWKFHVDLCLRISSVKLLMLNLPRDVALVFYHSHLNNLEWLSATFLIKANFERTEDWYSCKINQLNSVWNAREKVHIWNINDWVSFVLIIRKKRYWQLKVVKIRNL